MTTSADLNEVQAIREQWNFVTDAELVDIRANIGDGVTEYQLWLELRLAQRDRMIHYLARQIVGMNVPEDSPAIAEVVREAYEKCKEG
jgi:hypothetical protein